MDGKEYLIGEGSHFYRSSNKEIPLFRFSDKYFALGEVYMNHDLEVEGDLVQCIDHFSWQMGKPADHNAWKKLIHTSTAENQRGGKQPLWYRKRLQIMADETPSYSRGYFLHEDDTPYQAAGQ